MDPKELALIKHKVWQGKIEVTPRCEVESMEQLAIAYTPGVAQPCLEIEKDTDLSYVYTRRSNLVAVVTDGSAVLGLGNIGPEAGMPVMEGKCVLFKRFGNVDAFPLCIKSNDVDTIVDTVALLEGSFGGVNLEDISAPRCFEIEKKLNTNTSINNNIDKHIILKFLGTAVMGILESYVLDEIDSDVAFVATQVGELMRRNI